MVLSDRNRYAAVLAVIAIFILGVGHWLKPAPKPQNSGATSLSVTRAELENLQQLVRRNNLRSLSTSFTDVADSVIDHLALVQPWAVNGVFLPNVGLIVSKRMDAVPRQLSVTAGAATQVLVPNLWVPGLPFITTATSTPTAISPVHLSNSTPVQGAWVIVVANGVFGQTLVSPGIYNGIAQENCGPYIRYRLLTTVPLNGTHIGGGLFDLAGDLQGVVLQCDDGPAIIPSSEVKRAIAAVNTNAGHAVAKYGIGFGADPSTQSLTLVMEVWDDWPAADVGIEPGDQLVAVDGELVSSPQNALAALHQPGAATHELSLLRRRREIKVNLSPVSLETPTDWRPALTIDDASGVVVARVAKGSSADRAGILAGDRVLFINGRPATKATIQLIFAEYRVTQPVSLVVQRPGRRLLFLVQP